MIFRDSGFQRLIGGDDLLNPAHSASGGGSCSRGRNRRDYTFRRNAGAAVACGRSGKVKKL